MTTITEKVNKASIFLATLCDEPAERFSIASILVEMSKYEMSKTFTSLKEENKAMENDA